MEPPAAKSVPFFGYGCCVPTYGAVWLMMLLFFIIIMVIACFFGAGIAVRWMYKRRLRKECNAIRDKQRKIEENKREMNMKLRDIAAGPSRKKEFERNTKKIQNLTSQLSTIRSNSKSMVDSGMCSSNMAGSKQFFQQGALPPVSNLDPTISNKEFDVFTNGTKIQTSMASGSNISTFTSTATSNINNTPATTVITVNEEEPIVDNFHMEDTVLAGVLEVMAAYGSKKHLEKREIRNGPPILYSKNGRRMYPSDDFSSFKGSTINTTAGSGETNVKSDKPTSETTVSPSIMSNKKAPETDQENKKIKRKKSFDGSPIGKKQRSVTGINEEKENRDYRPVISDKEIGSPFPYYTETKTKESRHKSSFNRSNLEVRKADERMAKNTALNNGSRTSPTSNSTVSSWVPNVYDLRREADRQRAEMETENARTLLEERQKRMTNGTQSSKGLSSSVRPAHSASQILQKNGEGVYQTSRAAFISPYDIRINMDDSNSQRGFRK